MDRAEAIANHRELFARIKANVVPRAASARPVPAPPTPTSGVGTEIGKLLESLHIGTFKGCSCAKLKRDWDAAGIDWCEHRDELVAKLQENGKAKGWVFGVAAKLAAGPLVDLAIQNAKEHK